MRTHALHTERETDTSANASPSLSLPNPHPFTLLLPDQGVEGRAQGRVRLLLVRVLEILAQLAVAADWPGAWQRRRLISASACPTNILALPDCLPLLPASLLKDSNAEGGVYSLHVQ